MQRREPTHSLSGCGVLSQSYVVVGYDGACAHNHKLIGKEFFT